MSTLTIPVFPLHTVLFPGGNLPLRIFEPRYLDMVSHCMRKDCGFGVCLIREGSEVGKAPTLYNVGTLSAISYFERQEDGVLGITAFGQQRFRILASEVRPNQLTTAVVELIDPDPRHAVPTRCAGAVDILQGLMSQLDYPFSKEPHHYDDASWVSSRLAEFLPMRLEQKQLFLQMQDPLQRLENICQLLKEWELH